MVKTSSISEDSIQGDNILNILFFSLALSFWSLNVSNGEFHSGALWGYVFLLGTLILAVMSEKKNIRWLSGNGCTSVSCEKMLWILGLFTLGLMYNQHYMMVFNNTGPTFGLSLCKGIWMTSWVAFCPYFLKNNQKGFQWFLVVIAGGAALAYLSLVILLEPSPPTDVFVFQQEAVKALIHGFNPYEIVYTNIYGANTPFYPNGILSTYVYPPFSLLLSLPLVLTGDVRWELLFNHVLACVGIGYLAKKNGWSFISSAMISGLALFQAVIPHVIRHSWIEPRLIFWWVLLCILIRIKNNPVQSKGVAFLAGGLFSLKQYMVLWIIPAVIWFWKDFLNHTDLSKLKTLQSGLKVILWALFIPIITFGLFAIWNPYELWYDLVTFLFSIPFRQDGLTLQSWFYLKGWIKEGSYFSDFWAIGISFAVMIGGIFYAKSATTRILVLVAVLLVFFLLSKYAFVNYYYFIQMLLISAVSSVRCSQSSE